MVRLLSPRIPIADGLADNCDGIYSKTLVPFATQSASLMVGGAGFTGCEALAAIVDPLLHPAVNAIKAVPRAGAFHSMWT